MRPTPGDVATLAVTEPGVRVSNQDLATVRVAHRLCVGEAGDEQPEVSPLRLLGARPQLVSERVDDPAELAVIDADDNPQPGVASAGLWPTAERAP